MATPAPPVKGAAAAAKPVEAKTPVATVKAVFKDGQTPGPTPSPFTCEGCWLNLHCTVALADFEACTCLQALTSPSRQAGGKQGTLGWTRH